MAETVVSALRLNIIIGASFHDTITWRDSAGVLVPFPSGTEAEVKIRPDLYSDTVIARLHTTPELTDGLIVLTSPGVASLSFTDLQTALFLPLENAVFDIKYIFAADPPGTVIKLNDGRGRVDFHLAATRT